MLIKKGGITRNIDENHLHEYKAKGYAPVAVAQGAPAAPKQPKKDKAKE